MIFEFVLFKFLCLIMCPLLKFFKFLSMGVKPVCNQGGMICAETF